MTSPSDTSAFALGPWRVDPQLDTLHDGQHSVKLEPRTMRLLCVLAQAQGGLVRTETLLDTVWPQVVVTPGSLYEAVAQLRKILGPDAIATVPRKGYRLALLAAPSTPVGMVAAPALGPHALAVLPLRARQLPDSHAFIRESLLDELIAELSRHPQLVVVALGTMLSYAGQEHLSPQQIGRELGAAYLVDGLLELRGDTLRVRVQMVSTAQGTQSWVDAVELPLAAWWDTGALVAGRLARALNLELLDQAARAPAPALPGPDASQAQALASRAWIALFARPETREVTAQAQAWAEQAIALAPALPLASTCLAFCHWRQAQFGWGAVAAAAQRALALQHAEQAVALDPREPDAHYVLGLVAYSLGQAARAEESLRHCMRLSGSHAPAHGLLALIRTRRGHPQEAAALCARAFALSPREPLRVVWHLALAWAGLALHDYAAALEASQQAMAVNPDFGTAYLTGAAAAQQLGATEEARAWVAFLRQRTAFTSLQAVRERLPPAREAAHREQMDQLLRLLAAAGMP
ncbi:winged helix-turn-helix domain-containing tetratricopeptide repeat protein [Pseudorhodoferax soli]|uniref:winged helix-turn-helix domain-containing tetratricopeptide repeat protein n=1 Tax=Pseudorhodoferax soli TaxID=545864 RepID=UPI001472E4FF|nr:winged helix-turn-helix domain-containing protein [Pseudorhodoferax soli]